VKTKDQWLLKLTGPEIEMTIEYEEIFSASLLDIKIVSFWPKDISNWESLF